MAGVGGQLVQPFRVCRVASLLTQPCQQQVADGLLGESLRA